MKLSSVWMRAALALTLMNFAAGCGQAGQKCDPWISVALNETQEKQWSAQQEAGLQTTLVFRLMLAVDFGETKPIPVDVALHRADASDGGPIGEPLQIITVLPKDTPSGRVGQSVVLALAQKGSIQPEFQFAAVVGEVTVQAPRVCILSGSLLELK
ncbi:hypothetical protein [Dongia sp. agr-C8]